MDTSLFIGCAGWSLPSTVWAHFPAEGSHLERYAAVFNAVEINSSFYRPHRTATYARWRASVPTGFRFAVKVPRAITHDSRLQLVGDELVQFIEQCSGLEEKLGCLLVQLPPSLRYDTTVAEPFFTALRGYTDVDVVCEARHASWFSAAASRVLTQFRVARVTADPVVVEMLDAPTDIGAGTAYIRLHGSPVIYHSSYSDSYLDNLAGALDEHVQTGRRTWCVFDNTASGAAVPNALELLRRCSAAVIAMRGI